MSYFFPQCAVELRILPEDFKLTSDASLQSPYRVIVMARDVTVNINDYKTTDTFTIEIDYKNFPFDPRTIRACGVVVYMQDMERIYKDDGSLNTIVPGAKTKLNSKLSNAVIAGFVDEENIDFDDNKRMVKFEGRDYTALLIDQKYLVNTPISLNQKLDVAITTLLAAFKATAEIDVINNTYNADGTKADLPTLAQYYPDFGSPMAGHKNTGKHESYWDIIQDLANRAGLICYMHIDKLILSTPKNQSLGLDPVTNVPNTQTIDDIKVIYGVNVKNLKLKRKLGRFKGFNIMIVSRVEKEILSAKIPEEATVEWGKGFGFQYQPELTNGPNAAGDSVNFAPVSIPVMKPDGSVDKDQTHIAPYITFPVPNVANKEALIKIGQTTYEQYSLQQLEGSFETFEMIGRGTTRDGGIDKKSYFKAYDLTQITKGQTLCLEIHSDDLEKISRLGSESDRIDYLVLRNYRRDVASIFAKTMGKFSPRFQIKSYSMMISQDTGFKLTVHFQNIVDTLYRGLS